MLQCCSKKGVKVASVKTALLAKTTFSRRRNNPSFNNEPSVSSGSGNKKVEGTRSSTLEANNRSDSTCPNNKVQVRRMSKGRSVKSCERRCPRGQVGVNRVCRPLPPKTNRGGVTAEAMRAPALGAKAENPPKSRIKKPAKTKRKNAADNYLL